MTLQRWHEMECGDSSNYGAWCIVRGHKLTGATLRAQERGVRVSAPFIHDDDAKPYMERHEYRWIKDADGKQVNKVTTYYTLLPDRESGAKKRLAKIMARYPGFTAYIQTDPRGCALYILRPGDVREGADVSTCYSNGIGVCK